MEAALEMVDCDAELNGYEWDEGERYELARKMCRIALGMCYGWDLIDLHICNSLELLFLPRWTRKTAKATTKPRQRRRKRTAVAA